jgi:NADH-quinone oxidoreductase subunit N
MIVAAATALAVLLTDLLVPRWRWPFAVALGGVLLTLLAVLLTPSRQLGLFCAGESGVNCSYVFDQQARLVAAVIAALTGLALLLYAPALSRREAPAGEVTFLFAVAMTGGVALAGAGDLITLIVALETLTLPIYALVALHQRRAGVAAGAAVTFFVTSVIATAVSLLGASLLYLAGGQIYLRDAVAAAGFGDRNWGPVGVAGLALLLVGLGFKVAAVPMHAWAPATYDGAPVPVAAFLSTASKLGGTVAILIVAQAAVSGVFGTLGDVEASRTTGGTLAVLAVLSMVIGTLVALRQQRTVRLLAWSSVAQAGFILAPLGGLLAVQVVGRHQDLFDAALAYALFFMVMEVGAFSAVVALRPAAPDGGRLDDLGGLGRAAPLPAAALAVALIGLAGLPPVLVGLFAKITVIRALLAVDSFWLAMTAALISVVGLAVYWRPMAALYRSGDLEAAPVRSVSVVVAVGLTLAVALVLTVAPQLVFTMISAGR